jgi:hypothetical protein
VGGAAHARDRVDVGLDVRQVRVEADRRAEEALARVEVTELVGGHARVVEKQRLGRIGREDRQRLVRDRREHGRETAGRHVGGHAERSLDHIAPEAVAVVLALDVGGLGEEQAPGRNITRA